MKLNSPSALRYLLAGGFLWGVDFAVYWSLAAVLQVDVRIAQGAARLSGALVGFFAHRSFSFPATGAGHANGFLGQGAAYSAVAVGNLLISPFLVHAAVLALGGRLALGKVLVDVFLVAETYLLLRLVFRSAEARA